ncbi:MAG: hypothetical protein ACYS7Y_04120 [Planctomycetota bacterium]|jgi:hypothetical protein
MIHRYCGDVEIQLEVIGTDKNDFLLLAGRVIVGQDWWEFDNVIVKCKAVTPTAYTQAAINACHFASLYGTRYDCSEQGGEIPKWAPPADFSDCVNDALEVSDEGYVVRKEK